MASRVGITESVASGQQVLEEDKVPTVVIREGVHPDSRPTLNTHVQYDTS